MENGSGVVTDHLIFPKRSAVNPQIVALLQDLLKQAELGNITSISCICIGPNGSVQLPGSGMQVSELNLGADILKASLMTAIRADQSKIVKPA